MRKWTSLAMVSTFVVSMVFVTPQPVSAHHSFTAFWYMDKMNTIEGTVVELKIVNPHSEMTVEVANKDGSTALWRITATAGGIVGLQKVGWKAGMLVGTRVKVEGHPPRKEGGTGIASNSPSSRRHCRINDRSKRACWNSECTRDQPQWGVRNIG